MKQLPLAMALVVFPAPLLSHAVCSTPEQIAAAATVSPVVDPTAPTSTPDQDRRRGPDDRYPDHGRVRTLALVLIAPGLQIDGADAVRWTECRVDLVRTAGFSALTDSGVAVGIGSRRAWAGTPKFVLDEPDTPHPTVPGARFVGSTSLVIGLQRAGLWVTPDGRSTIARYTPGGASVIPILSSHLRLLGLAYLPSPDAPGGYFKLWQRVGRSSYRSIAIGWSEVGLRPPWVPQ